MSTQSQATMKAAGQDWVRWLIATLVIAFIALLASPTAPLGAFWRPSPDMPMPTSSQLPLFMLLNIAEVLTFGIGLSFLVFGYPLVQRVLPQSKGLAFAAYLSIAWLLGNWWIHDSLHMANGTNLGGLLAIEYGFHVTLMAAGVILAYFFVAVVRQQSTSSR